jgi:hypothetical protein
VIEIGERLLPVMRKVAAMLEAFYRALPGMPYTGPSRWRPEQMAGAQR